MSHRKTSMVILSSVIVLIILMLLFGAHRGTAVMAAGSASSPVLSPGSQIIPTSTPQIVDAGEVLMTNPVLLQVMILLSFLTLVVIFWGVWINRHSVDGG